MMQPKDEWRGIAYTQALQHATETTLASTSMILMDGEERMGADIMPICSWLVWVLRGMTGMLKLH